MSHEFKLGKYVLTFYFYKANQGWLFGLYVPGYVSSKEFKFGVFRYRFSINIRGV